MYEKQHRFTIHKVNRIINLIFSRAYSFSREGNRKHTSCLEYALYLSYVHDNGSDCIYAKILENKK